MMAMLTQLQTKPGSKPAPAAVADRILQRKCACSGPSQAEGEEMDAPRKTASLRLDGSRLSPGSGYDFGQIRVQPASVHALRLDGLVINAEADEEGISLDQPPQPAPAPGATPPPPPPPPAPRPAPRPAPAPTRPTTISVAQLFQAPITAANVTAGFHSGFGGVARMEVSDPGGRDWAGTAVHENITSATNTCQPGTAACPNTGGEGGAAGSTFNVGDGSNGLGVSLPATRNSFYDFHLFGVQPNVLHDAGLPRCEQTCTQRYDIGGTMFGPTFTIRRAMTPDQLTVNGHAVDVTQVALDKG
jgi:hypothetical protein